MFSLEDLFNHGDRPCWDGKYSVALTCWLLHNHGQPWYWLRDKFKLEGLHSPSRAHNLTTLREDLASVVAWAYEHEPTHAFALDCALIAWLKEQGL